jgi:uncharacterized protein YehS (DUF1456 family)
MSAKSEDPDATLLQKHAAALSEHFDSVQIFVTRLEANATRCFVHGEGNWYARYGQVIDWIKREDEHGYQEIRKDQEN